MRGAPASACRCMPKAKTGPQCEGFSFKILWRERVSTCEAAGPMSNLVELESQLVLVCRHKCEWHVNGRSHIL